jgi:uncharacterized protein (DUF849 family)
MRTPDALPVIIEAALNGDTRPERNPHVPRKPAEIAEDALRCLDAGASLLHAHADDMRATGRAAADLYLAAWRPIMAARPDTLWYPTLTTTRDPAEGMRHVEILARCRWGRASPSTSPASCAR